jgi:hypothetical protein
VKWSIEPIPDEDPLYRRVHANLFPSANSCDDIPPGAFHDTDGISTDWSKYSTAAESRNRAAAPAKNAVIQLTAGDVRSFKSLRVDHEPEDGNRSHSCIRGLKACRREDQTDIRKHLARLSSFAIRLDM